jgi:hypothetical protein
MAREKAPAYQRYPKQIMGDDKVLLMDWDAYGMHNWLLDISWQQDPRGTIPDDTAVLRRWLRNPSDETWRRVWPQINTAWPILEGGRRGNAGMIRCAEKQANYSSGNKGKEKYANRTQNCSDSSRKYIEGEEEVGFVFVLPSWIPEKAWSMFLDMRSTMNPPLTEEIKVQLIKELESLRDRGNSVEAVIWQSVTNGWRGFFPIKGESGIRNNRPIEAGTDRSGSYSEYADRWTE